MGWYATVSTFLEGLTWDFLRAFVLSLMYVLSKAIASPANFGVRASWEGKLLCQACPALVQRDCVGTIESDRTVHLSSLKLRSSLIRSVARCGKLPGPRQIGPAWWHGCLLGWPDLPQRSVDVARHVPDLGQIPGAQASKEIDRPRIPHFLCPMLDSQQFMLLFGTPT